MGCRGAAQSDANILHFDGILRHTEHCCPYALSGELEICVFQCM